MAARKKRQAVIEVPVFTRMGERMLAGIIDASTLAAELGKIEVLTPKTFVSAARDVRSPLHAMFEWDDEIAGERYREDQARFWIACLHFRRSDAPEGASTPRMIYNVNTGNGHRYIHIDVVRSNLDYQRTLIGQAIADMERAETRYSHIVDICEPLRRAREELEALRRKYDAGDGPRPDA